MRPESGFINPSASLRIVLLPEPATPKMALVSPCGRRKEMSSSTTLSSNARVTFSKRMASLPCCFAAGAGMSSGSVGADIVYRYPNRVMSSFVTKKSVTRIITEATTTAWVVERPTPCVPPRVDMPK